MPWLHLNLSFTSQPHLVQTIAIELAWVAFSPVLVAVVTMWLARRADALPRAAWAASVGLAYVVGQIVLTGRTAFAPAVWASISPREALHWLPLIVLSAAGVSILASVAPAAWQRGVTLLATLLVIGTPIRLLAGNIAQHWTLIEKFAHLTLIAAAFALVWLLLTSANDNRQSRTRTLLMILVASVSAALLVKSGTMLYGQLAGVLAAAIAGTALAEWIHPDSGSGLSGAAGVITLALGSLLLLGHFYSELPSLTAALLALSLIVAGGHLPPFANRGPAWQQALIRTILCLMPLALAIAT